MACWKNNAAHGNNSLNEIAGNGNSNYYMMSPQNRRTAVIFNHKHFTVKSLQTRSGTEDDCDKLEKALKQLGFDVEVYNDLTFNDLKTVVKEVAKADHSENDAFVMAILTHGQNDYLFAKDVPYRPDLWSWFTAEKCPSLSNKPKLFFIQACQGHTLDPGVVPQRTNVDEEILPDSTNINHSANNKCSSYDDILIAFSPVPDDSFSQSGSWFIKALSSELEKQGRNLDLFSLLAGVSGRMAVYSESYLPEDPSCGNDKKIPCVVSMLTKLLIFP